MMGEALRRILDASNWLLDQFLSETSIKVYV